MKTRQGSLHHIELWVPDLLRATETIGWLLLELGYTPYQSWQNGKSWKLNETYLVIEESPALISKHYNRLHAGLNHLAFHVSSPVVLDQLITKALQHGWSLLYPELHPHAGGLNHYTGYLENSDGFEVELVAS